ncbi:MAG: hypothetical protein GWN56_12980 [Nitrosopumilaceae archaeon]|nr:hypothetical protein [Nitrosopumilaceae archaeon]
MGKKLLDNLRLADKVAINSGGNYKLVVPKNLGKDAVTGKTIKEQLLEGFSGDDLTFLENVIIDIDF